MIFFVVLFVLWAIIAIAAFVKLGIAYDAECVKSETYKNKANILAELLEVREQELEIARYELLEQIKNSATTEKENEIYELRSTDVPIGDYIHYIDLDSLYTTLQTELSAER